MVRRFRVPAGIMLAFALSLFSLSSCVYGASGTVLDSVIRSFAASTKLSDVAISPDGRRVAWVESLPGAGEGKTAIYVASVALPGAAHRVTAGEGGANYREGDPAWSPDSDHLAFLSDAARPGQQQLYVLKVPGGTPQKLTNLTGDLAGPQWSPDGRSLAFLYIENAPRASGPLAPMAPPSGVIQLHVYEQRLTVVDLASRRARRISPSDLYIYQYDWAPDSKRLVATGAHGPGDDNWYVAQLYVIDAASGSTRRILKPGMQVTNPAWSPDGKEIAFIGGLMSDEGSHGGDIYVTPAEGGRARDVTPQMKASASGIFWLRSPEQILFTEDVDGLDGIAEVSPAGGKVNAVWTSVTRPEKNSSMIGFSVAKDGRTSAAILESFQNPPEVWSGLVGAWRQITHANGALHPSWGMARSIHWESGGWRIQGWLTYPRKYNSSRRYPMVVLVHGGPGGMNRPSWPVSALSAATAALSGEGYFVLYPNPRGSFGSGEAFTKANVRDFGHGDLQDILAGVTEVVQTLPVDRNRIGITGWSYGGYMTMWTVTQTHLFHAAVAGAGIADWLSYYGENDIDGWLIPFFKASVYDDPAIYARSSPINYIKNVRTPTLILVGDRDGECPAPQSFEFWHALTTLGVKTQLVVYPDEGHSIWQYKHQVDIIRREVAWFNAFLK
ncbi:MAG: prolyl oligopeptidase family serine peptidase [Terriglobia bacterium]